MDFTVGVMWRWLKIAACAILLTTDVYRHSFSEGYIEPRYMPLGREQSKLIMSGRNLGSKSEYANT